MSGTRKPQKFEINFQKLIFEILLVVMLRMEKFYPYIIMCKEYFHGILFTSPQIISSVHFSIDSRYYIISIMYDVSNKVAPNNSLINREAYYYKVVPFLSHYSYEALIFRTRNVVRRSKNIYWPTSALYLHQYS